MHATKSLPDDFHHLKTLNLSGLRVSLWLNLIALFLLLPLGWFFGQLIYIIRGHNPLTSGIFGFFNSFSGLELPALLLSIIVMIVVHELVHAFFFWLFTRARPKFALKSGYAFAAAPEWFLPRSEYIIVGLSPLVIISIVSILLTWVTASPLIPYLLLVATFNAAGSFGDFITIAWVIRQRGDILIKDEGAVFSTFGKD